MTIANRIKKERHENMHILTSFMTHAILKTFSEQSKWKVSYIMMRHKQRFSKVDNYGNIKKINMSTTIGNHNSLNSP